MLRKIEDQSLDESFDESEYLIEQLKNKDMDLNKKLCEKFKEIEEVLCKTFDDTKIKIKEIKRNNKDTSNELSKRMHRLESSMLDFKVIKITKVINVELPTLASDENKVVMETGTMIHEYLSGYERKYMKMKDECMVLGGGLYKKYNMYFRSQYQRGSSLWKVFMYVQTVLLADKIKCHISALEKKKFIDAEHGGHCVLCHDQGKRKKYRESEVKNKFNAKNLGDNSLELFSKIFMIKMYEILLDAMSSKGYHMMSKENLFNKIVKVDYDVRHRYAHSVKIVRIIGGEYYNFITMEKENVQDKVPWIVSNIENDSRLGEIQLMVYRKMQEV